MLGKGNKIKQENVMYFWETSKELIEGSIWMEGKHWGRTGIDVKWQLLFGAFHIIRMGSFESCKMWSQLP